MVKAIKVMLIPNNVQKTKLFQYAGASRFAYNWALAREIENYEKGGKFISDAELRKEFTKLRHSDEYAWLLNISNNVTKQAIKDACTAYKNFFRGLQKSPTLCHDCVFLFYIFCFVIIFVKYISIYSSADARYLCFTGILPAHTKVRPESFL